MAWTYHFLLLKYTEDKDKNVTTVTPENKVKIQAFARIWKKFPVTMASVEFNQET